MSLRFYNTLSQQVEDFAPAADNTVRMYSCGPTVYNYGHIGNFRTFTFVDILRRWLKASGFQIDHVMNITDVDDKTIRDSQRGNPSGFHRSTRIPRRLRETRPAPAASSPPRRRSHPACAR